MNLNDKHLGDKLWEICQNEVVMFPNFGHYLVYNELAYQFMANDNLRKEFYNKAIEKKVKDKIVVEIGPGSQLIWTLLCVEAGARKIYAIEENEIAYEKAKQLAEHKGVTEKIELIRGLSTEVNLPELADICVSEIIGSIGNSEGAASYLNDVKRLMKPNGVMIPEGCITLLAPCFKPVETYTNNFIDEYVKLYKRNIFHKIGKEVDFTRYKIYNFPKSNLVASPQIFEEMWFNDEPITQHFDKVLQFSIEKSSNFDGLILWINLYFDSETVLDALDSKICWSPVYIPMKPFALQKGDVIEVRCVSKISKNVYNPDYFFESLVKRNDEIVYRCLKESNYA
jgi:predicted RNA methylase